MSNRETHDCNAAANDFPRRAFLGGSAMGLAAAGQFGFLSALPRVDAQEAGLDSKQVKFSDDIEPLVSLLENTARADVLEKVAARIQTGTSYQQVLAALLLAGIRNVQPRPSVGFKFHCVLVVNSCHLASLAGPDNERWLPIFWAIDYFKASQAEEARTSGWQMPAVNDHLVPTSLKSKQLFEEAMETWDVDKADVATAGLVRTTGATEIFNLFAKYAARDYRSIGHKAIYLANSWRTLQVIGWRYAEPVLRSLAFAILNHNGEPNPADSDLPADRPWRENGERLKRVPITWRDGVVDARITPELFPAFRSGTPQDASETAVDWLASGVSPQSVWDGVFCGAAELLMRQPGIIGIHGLTTANALHYLYDRVEDLELRQRLLLQACSFNPMFREDAKSRGKLAEITLEDLPELEFENANGDRLAEIMADISGNRMQSAGKLRSYLAAGGSADEFMGSARRLLFVKGRDAHDYKFASAVLEDYGHISREWRDQFLSLSVFNLKGSGHADSGLVERTKSAFAV